MIKFIRDLHWSGMLKADWDPDEHPRWPAGSPDSRGGQFAPKDAEGKRDNIFSMESKDNADRKRDDGAAMISAGELRDIPGRRSEEECEQMAERDWEICRNLPKAHDRKLCWASASDRLAQCLRGKPIPPLVLPENESPPVPQSMPSLHPPHKIPWRFFLPWFLPATVGVPA